MRFINIAKFIKVKLGNLKYIRKIITVYNTFTLKCMLVFNKAVVLGD